MIVDHDLLTSLDGLRRRRAGRIRPMHAADSREWRYDREAIRHRTDRFFSIVGIEQVVDTNGERANRTQPIINQHEIGTLAFLFRRTGGGQDVLVQLKNEPGNVNGIQVAPTCQTTLSNLQRAHGGQAPPGFELASAGPWAVLSDSLQSEQGTRFYRKRNRNLSLMWSGSGSGPEWADREFVWTDVRTMLRLLGCDYTVNTDARSVLLTTPWQFLSWDDRGHPPVDPFYRDLRDSYQRQSPAAAIDHGEHVVSRLAELRQRARNHDPILIPLEALPGYRFDHRGLRGIGAAAEFDVLHFEVSIPGRERGEWDQPLLASRSPGLCRLYACWQDRELRFILRLAHEAGLFDRVELHPTIVRRPGQDDPSAEEREFGEPPGDVVRQVWQSEEGGRFFRDVNLYQVVLMKDRPNELPADCIALSVREIEWLAPLGVFTNEARSTLSLLLQH
jgi:oxidase EvaA